MALESFTIIGESEEALFKAIPRGKCTKVFDIDDDDKTTFILGCRPDDQGAEVHTVAMNYAFEEINPENAGSLLGDNSRLIRLERLGHFTLELRDNDGNPMVSLIVMHFPDGTLLN